MRSQKRYMVAIWLMPIVMPVLAQTAYFRTTIQADSIAHYSIPWIDSGSRAATAWAPTANYIEIIPGTRYQTIMGFGGTFQEKGWDALSHLSAAGRDSVIRALFDTSGCNLNWGRVPIGLCDFDDNYAPYSLDDSGGDYQMKYFSLARDSLKRIPLIKWAQTYQPNLRFWGCPWSPPAWMKSPSRYYGAAMKTDSATLAAYALYLEKTVDAFKAKGINLEMITCQNEPTSATGGYPQCTWTNAQELTFFKQHLIPRFTKDSVASRVMLGVYCCNNFSDWISFFMNDPLVSSFVNATSHSWQNPDWGDSSSRYYPGVPFFETESEYGNPHQNWTTGLHQFQNLDTFMTLGKASVYTEWNLINNQTCKSDWGWTQDVMVVIDTTNGHVIYTPYYYACKHFSHYVKVGARGVALTAHGLAKLTTAAFINPDTSIILVAGSTDSIPTPITVKIYNVMFKATLPPNSFNTFKIVGVTVAVRPEIAQRSAGAKSRNARIRNSTLYFSLPPETDAREADVTLCDLQGRVLWTGRRTGSALQGNQAFAIRPAQGNLHPAVYLLTVRIRNGAGVITSIEQKVARVN